MNNLVKSIILAASLAVSTMAHPVVASEIVSTLNGNPKSLHPAKARIGEEYVLNVLMYNGLTRITPDLKIEGDLAESWESNEDSTVWTFNLRKGVKFHHGKELVADDVIKTFETIADKATESRARSHTELITMIEKDGDYKVIFHLKQSYSGWAQLMIERQLKILPSDRTIDELADAPSGTGPFMFKEFMHGDKVVLVKNPNYFEEGKPKLDKITFRIMPEDAAKIAALKSGDVDLIWNAPIEAIAELSDVKGITVDAKPTATWDGIVLNNEKPPFDDVRVRKAVFLALDKRELMKAAVFGHGAATHSPIPPNHPFFNSAISFEPDVEGAKKLLAEAGYADGLEITINVPVGRPTRERAAVVVQQMLENVGITANINMMPLSRYYPTVAGKAPFYMDGFFARPTADTSTYPWYHSSGSWNKRMWHFKSENMDRILDEARMTSDKAKLKSLYGEYQQEMVEKVPGVILYVKSFVTAYKSSLKGYTTHPYLWMDLSGAYIEE